MSEPDRISALSPQTFKEDMKYYHIYAKCKDLCSKGPTQIVFPHRSNTPPAQSNKIEQSKVCR